MSAPSPKKTAFNDGGFEMRFYCLVAALVGLGLAAPANAANSCAAFVAKQTSASKAADVARILLADRNQTFGANGIGKVMVEGPWRLVWATPKDAERGVYFFRRSKKGGYRLAKIWGGVLAPDERQDGIKWASQITGGGPSARLAGCFADAVVAGE
jgi:hypothetical protein